MDRMRGCDQFARAALWLLALGIPGCRELDPAPLPAAAPSAAEPETALAALSEEPLQPLPARIDLDPAKVRLGERLFSDPRLSGDSSVSCATCHPLGRGGTDGLSHSRGAEGKTTAVNTPTVFNSGLNFRFNWNGVYTTLESELDAPMRRAMGTDAAAVVAQLQTLAEYRESFAAIYPEGITADSFRDALATFERSLLTPNSRFDRYLRGETSALSEEEKRGYALFKSHGCASCHQGVNVGGNLFQRMGVIADYFAERGDLRPADLGLFNATANPRDRHVFRVPSLRNVAVTAPYFHDGSVRTLEGAITAMGRYQLGRVLTPDEVRGLAAFLRTLTGEYRGRPL